MKVQKVNTDPDRHRGDPNRAGIGLDLIPKPPAGYATGGSRKFTPAHCSFLGISGPLTTEKTLGVRKYTSILSITRTLI